MINPVLHRNSGTDGSNPIHLNSVTFIWPTEISWLSLSIFVTNEKNTENQLIHYRNCLPPLWRMTRSKVMLALQRNLYNEYRGFTQFLCILDRNRYNSEITNPQFSFEIKYFRVSVFRVGLVLLFGTSSTDNI